MYVATQPAAARQLAAILNTLSKRAQRRGKLAVVKSMTTSGQYTYQSTQQNSKLTSQ
jgi:hypothetical protein